MYDGAASLSARSDPLIPRVDEGRRGAGLQPVFLHGMWRSGSTFLWSCFRVAEGTCCYYEPLHHGLAKLTHARIERDTPAKISANRHPALDAPYFAEFAPLIRRRGVRGHHAGLAYDRFVLRPGEDHPRLERYIAGLIDHAVQEDRTAVLGFNRTGLRLAWLKSRFAAYNIHIDREPAQIWASYTAEARQGNHAFFAMWLAVIESNARHPVFAPLAERLGLRGPLAPLGFARAKARRRRIIEAMTEDETYFMVFYLWLACTTHALAECDLLIDTRLAAPHYARRIAARIADETGLAIDLTAMRAPQPRVDLAQSTRDRIERSAQEMFPRAAVPRTLAAAARGLSNLSPQGADLLGAVF